MRMMNNKNNQNINHAMIVVNKNQVQVNILNI